VPDLEVDLQAADRLRLHFSTPARADRFHQALLAESMPAELDTCFVDLHIQPWYTPADIQSVALAIAKVAHYLEARRSRS